jgi:hypothetical protein
MSTSTAQTLCCTCLIYSISNRIKGLIRGSMNIREITMVFSPLRYL